MRRRAFRQEPARCVCEPGADAAKEHAKPGVKAAAHTNPKCPHSELAHTTKPIPKKRKITRIRFD